MEYTVSRLGKISGISPRTLRYYDEIGLLKPARIGSNGYRIYGQKEVDILQQILFYRELDMSLEDIKNILQSPGFDLEESLQNHLLELEGRRKRIDLLIENVNKTISSLKGEVIMSDKEKFEAFKKELVDENENKYGKEIRDKYGDKAVDSSNARLKEMDKDQWLKQEDLSNEISEKLKAAVETGDPAGDLAQEVCDLHRRWLCIFWADGMYSKEMHKAMGEMYVTDERFKAHYDKVCNGAAQFLKEALDIYCSK